MGSRGRCLLAAGGTVPPAAGGEPPPDPHLFLDEPIDLHKAMPASAELPPKNPLVPDP